MSNHLSADNLKFPGDDRRLDLTDVFVFQASDSPEHHHTLLHHHHPGTTVLIMDSNPTSAPPPIPAPTTRRSSTPARSTGSISTPTATTTPTSRSFVFSEAENGKQTGTAWYATGAVAASPSGRRCASREHPGELRRHAAARAAGGSGCAPGCAATRSSPTSKAPCTASSGPGTTISPATTSTRSCWRYPTTCSAARSSACGPRSAGAATACWSSWTAAGTRPSTRSSTPTGRRTCSTPGSPPMTWPTTWGRGRRSWKTPAATPPRRPGRPPSRYARHPALRPHQARRLPQRPRPHRRRLQPALAGEQRQDPPVRPQTARRPAGPLPLPRPAQPQLWLDRRVRRRRPARSPGMAWRASRFVPPVRPEVAVPDHCAVTRARRRALEQPGEVDVRQALGDVAHDVCLAFGYVDRTGPDLKGVYPRIVRLGSRHGHVLLRSPTGGPFVKSATPSA